MAKTGGNKNAIPPDPTTKTLGWSKGASLRNNKFLYSVIIKDIQSIGISFSLTVGKIIPSPKDFHLWIKNLLSFFRNNNAICWHWVIEWQCRGVPHLHGVVYFAYPESDDASKLTGLAFSITSTWLRYSEQTESQAKAQYFAFITDGKGWLMYLAKHTAHGIRNYQRSPENIPKSWLSGTGKMWGKGGNWAQIKPIDIPLTKKHLSVYRRLLVKYLSKQAHTTKQIGNIGYVLTQQTRQNQYYWRHYLKHPLGEYRGISTVIDLPAARAICSWVIDNYDNPDPLKMPSVER